MSRTMRLIKQFFRDVRGLSAVEFALISPLLILFYFSTVEIDSALTVHRRVASTAGTVADLVAQDDVITPAEANAIFDSANAIMAPYDPGDTIKIRISSVRLGGQGNKPRVVWSLGHNWTARSTNSEVTGLPGNLLSGTTTVIMAEAEYSYTAPLSEVVDRPLVMTQTFFMRPRRETQVCYDTPSSTTNVC